VLCANAASRPAIASASPATCCRVTTSTTSSWSTGTRHDGDVPTRAGA
jgi:hypothetical protein